MGRIMLEVAYDGSAYHGWQLEPGVPTVEFCLNTALERLTGERIQVSGASRTDAGVHALGNLCVLDTESPIPPARMGAALQAYLPPDIVIRDSRAVAADFHPRFCDSVKEYEYTLYRDPKANPLVRNRSWHIYRHLDPEAMARGGAQMVGEQDFASFCAAGAQVSSTVRRILSLDIREEGPFLKINVRGNGFLYNMVRIISGTLVQLGLGRWPVERVSQIIAARDRSQAGPTAPPQGLCLMKIDLFPAGYPEGLWKEGR